MLSISSSTSTSSPLFKVALLGQQLAAITLDLLADRLAAAAGHVHNLVVLDEPVDLAIDLDLQPRVGDRVFEREVGQIGTVVERPLPCFVKRDRVLAGRQRLARRPQTRCRNVKRSAGVIFTSLLRLAVEADRDRHVGPVLAAGFKIVGQGLDAKGRVAGRVPVAAVPAVIEHVLDQPRRQLALGIGAGQQLEIERVGLDLAAIPHHQ